uniref:Uncharacterized protein n=1 Tax=Microplitis mediator bracovirus TaxID=1836595 RepID=A0A1D5APE0_9VIRU|nr:hypothetical protein A6F54_5 [Microplitis mediator bracovirus]
MMKRSIQKCKETGEEIKLVASENIQKLKDIMGIRKKTNEQINHLERKSAEKSREQLDESNIAVASTSSHHTGAIDELPASRPTELHLKMSETKSPFYYESKSKEDRSSSSSGSEVTETTSISGSLSD